MLDPGDPVPTFAAPTPSHPHLVFDLAAGRYLLLCVIPKGDAAFAETLALWLAVRRPLFDDRKLSFFGVVRDPAEFSGRADSLPGLRWLLDGEGGISAALRMSDGSVERSGWILVDPTLRVLQTFGVGEFDALDMALASLPEPALHAGLEVRAPVLIAPRIFEHELCRALIDAYREAGGQLSGFMAEVDGKTVSVKDPGYKMRRDFLIPPGPLRDRVRARLSSRLVPEIRKAFQFVATRTERDLVACYDATEQGFFAPHRDDASKGTAHRRFAITLNLNAEEYDGGDLRFPEFGPHLYRAPTGGACVFSCSLLHEAMPVREGQRYAFLAFLYDEAAARQRETNARFVGPVGSDYRATHPS